MSSTIVQYYNIITKMVQICFKVMINYIIAVTSHARRNNVFGFLSNSIFTDNITLVMNSFWIDSVFTLELKHSAPNRVCLICTFPN